MKKRKTPRTPDRRTLRKLEDWLIDLNKKGELYLPLTAITEAASLVFKFDFADSTIRTLVKDFDLHPKKPEHWGRSRYTRSNQTDRVFVLAQVVDDLVASNKLTMSERATAQLLALLERRHSPFPEDRRGTNPGGNSEDDSSSNSE